MQNPSYIKQLSRPKIIAHRGFCSILPENTIEAFLAGMYEGCDFIELDVVLDKNKELIVIHDPFLTRSTNITEMEQFKERKTLRKVDKDIKDDWWVIDFTVEELKVLSVKQAQLKGRPTIFDNKFKIPTLEEVLLMLKEFNLQHQGTRNPDGNLVGVLIELKDASFHREYQQIEIAEVLQKLLIKLNLNTVEEASLSVPIVLMSFEPTTVKLCKDFSPTLPRVQLITKDQYRNQEIKLEDAAQYADIMGPDLKLLWSKDEQKPTELVDLIHSYNMLIYSWGVADDNKRTLNTLKCKSPKVLYQKLFQLQIEGIITEFPGVALSFAEALIQK